MKWINTQRDDNVRCRLEARQEEDEKLDPSVSSAMLPMEGVSSWISHLQTEQVNIRGERLELMELGREPCSL